MNELVGGAAGVILQSAVNGAIEGQSVEKALKGALKTLAIQEASAFLAQTVGDYRVDLGFVGHKIAHAMVGGAMGAVMGQGKTDDVVSGAVAAVVAETVAETLPCEKANLKANKTSTSTDTERSWGRFFRQNETRAQIGKLVAVTVAAFANLNSDIALATADNAVMNNMLNHVPDQESVDTATDMFEEGLKYVNETVHDGIEYAQDVIAQNPLIQNDPLARLQHEAKTVIAHELADMTVPTTMMGVALSVAPIGKVKNVAQSGKELGKKIVSYATKSEAQLGKGVAEGALGIQQSVKTVAPKVTTQHNVPAVKKQLLPGEGKVGTYGELDKLRKKGDNLTPHHMPQNSYMKTKGVSTNDGVSMMMEQPNPGKGGRHRQTRTYGKKPNLSETPRQALARDVKDARKIYKEEKLYDEKIRDSLQEVIKKNKEKHSELFSK